MCIPGAIFVPVNSCKFLRMRGGAATTHHLGALASHDRIYPGDRYGFHSIVRMKMECSTTPTVTPTLQRKHALGQIVPELCAV